jgi:hypothetical protein
MRRLFGFALTSALLGLFIVVPMVQGQGFIVTSKSISEDLPLDPRSSDWDKAPGVTIPLSSQIIFTPRATSTPLGRSSVRQVEVKSLNNGKQIAIRLEWPDRTDNSGQILEDTPYFKDAAAIQFPAPGGKEQPYFGMGNEGSPVNIWQWRSDLENDQALRAIPLGDSYAGESSSNVGRNWYDGVWKPLGPPKDKERMSPVEDLIAVGFSTLSLQDSQDVMGKGVYDGSGKWSAVFLRDLQTKDKEDVVLKKGATVPIAFAMWDGNNEERDGLKSISTWHELKID